MEFRWEVAGLMLPAAPALQPLCEAAFQGDVQEGCAMAHLVLGTRVQCPMQKTWVYSQRTGFTSSGKSLESTTSVGRMGKAQHQHWQAAGT